MPDRAESRLSERAAELVAYLESDKPSERARAIEGLAWCLVEQGEAGAAFELLWNDASALDPVTRVALRAELQAMFGNEQAALDLLREMPEVHEQAPMARARVSMARGDWRAAVEHAGEARRCSATHRRATLVGARAHLALEQHEHALAWLDALESPDDLTQLETELLRATTTAGDPRTLPDIAEAASRRGALRLAADAWADVAAVTDRTSENDGARAAALRAVEIWDDIATSLPPPLRAGFWRDSRRASVRQQSKGRSSTPRPASWKEAMASLLANLRLLGSERDLSKLLALITDGAVALSGAERGFVLLTDEDGNLEAATVRDAEHRLGPRAAAFSRSIAETVLIDGEPVITVDAVQDARVQDYLSVHQLMLKSIACLPVRSGARIWGVLYLEHRSQRGRFSGADLELLEAYADQAAIAIETAGLFEEVHAQQTALREANEALRHANERLTQQLDRQPEELGGTHGTAGEIPLSTRADGQRFGIVGASAPMRQLFARLERVAPSGVPVVVSGESGTGKELIARAIHRLSERAPRPFVSLNCAAIPDGLLESELFGHRQGAFTGATRDHRGVFVEADGGTLFLDEVADMPSRMQLDLLRILQDQKVRPVGGSKEHSVDVRLVTASQRPLRALVESGALREDLYYRLAVVELRVPPLRERREDIPLLCAHFLSRHAKEQGEPRKILSRGALERLAAHPFPGNVRELEHLLTHAAVFAPRATIEAEDLAIDPPEGHVSPAPSSETYRDFKEAERNRILATLNAHGWNRAKAARALGMARRTFYRRLKEHDIELPKNH